MEDNTTTNVPVEDGGTIQGIQVDEAGSAVPQPEATESTEAVTTPEDNSQEANTNQEPAPADNSTVEWLKKKGVDPSSPEAIEKVAEMARNAEKAFHEKAQKASELEKSVEIKAEEVPVDATPAEIDSARVRNIELKQQLIDWRQSNPDKRDYETQMTEVLNQDPNIKAMVREGYISIDKLFAMTKGMDSGRDESLKSQVEKETLQKLAQKQQAAVPTGNAVAPSGTGAEPITSQNVDKLVAQHDLNWFMKNQDAINRAMAGN